MRTATRLGAFAAGLAVVFGAAAGAGALVGPAGPAVAAPASGSGAPAAHGEGPAAPAAPGPVEPPGGLSLEQDGYRLELATDSATAGAAVPVAFRLLGPDGAPVTAYTRSHERDLHLIAVRRDASGFQHVHPSLAADGTWSTVLDLTAGDWRVFADTVPAGADGLVLGADLAVAGDYAPEPLPEPAATAEVDGYTVALDGALVPGEESELTLTVSRDGRPVTDLQPYLGAYGHLVALRDGDLAFLHVHPLGEPGDGSTPPGPGVTFAATAPSTGTYRLFLDFQHGGVVRTAAFTVRADGTPAPQPAAAPERAAGSHGADGHAHDEETP